MLGVVKRTSKTVVLTALVHYALLSAVLWPLRLACALLRVLSLFLINLDASRLLGASMAIYPLLTLLLVRHVYHAQLEECFVHTLTKLDPKYASHLAARPRRFKPTVTERLLKRLGLSAEDGDDLRTMLLLMAAGLLLRGWRNVPYVGWLVAPVIQFLIVRDMVGRPAAAAAFSLAAAASPAWEAPILSFAELWASSKVLGRANLRFFLERCVPRQQRAAFTKQFEYTLVSYFLLPTALMRLPLLGSLVAFPAAAVGAYALQDILSRQGGALKAAFDHLD